MKSIEVEGFTDITRLSSGLYSSTFKALRSEDKKLLLLKVAKSSPAEKEEASAIAHEREMMERLSASPALPALHPEVVWKGGPLLAMEYIDTPSLATLLANKGRFPLEEFLHFAIAAATALENIHRYHIIHKDFNPFNLLYDEEKKRCWVVDFGLSIPIDHQKVIPIDPRFLEGTVAYLSPEQTGRMNRGIDYRTDYYSLGVTLYEAIAGELPFFSKEPLELIHAHIAEEPLPPSKFDRTIPDIISAIILKLMSKEPEERYQSIAGIRGDLEECLAGLHEGKISPFPLASRDTHERFEIPEKIYGRENDVARLLDIYEEVMRGKHHLVAIGGAPGVGKTSLVHEMYKPIEAKEGEVISGKFEQFKRNIPYFAISQALGEYAERLLTLPLQEQARFRRKILRALGNNGQIIVDIVPALEKVIGEQPPLLEVGLEETQNRFIYTFREFMQLLPTKERPLVLFLDDMQRADIPSIKLVEMLHESAIAHLLIVIGYRDSEVDEGHPLILMLKQLENRGMPCERFSVGPLTPSATEALLADALYKEPGQVHPLAKACQAKSGGNPFFLKQLLESFYENDWIYYDWDSALWQWELEKIELAPISDNVAELMEKKIAALPPNLIEVLTTAACIGNRFPFELLEKLSEEKGFALRQTLERLLGEELIIAEEKRYYDAAHFRFAHDRIQEGAHRLLESKKAVALHYQIAEELEKEWKREEKKKEELLFAIVDHYNRALEFEEKTPLASEGLWQHVAELNALAAKAAKASAAYAVAVDYSEKALSWFGQEGWKSHYHLLIEMTTEAMESAFLADDPEKMRLYGALLREKSETILDSYRAYTVTGLYHISKGENNKAAATLLEALYDLGFSFPSTPGELRVALELAATKVRQLYLGMTIEKLKERKQISDPVAKAFLELYTNIATSLYLSGKINLFALIVLKGMQLIYTHGNHEQAIAAYSAFAIILIDIGAINSGYRFGKLTLSLCDSCSDPRSRTTGILVARGLIVHWMERLHDQVPLLLKNYHEALSVGNLQYAAYSLVISLRYGLFCNASLIATLIEVEEYYKPLYRLRNSEMIAIHRYFHAMLLELAIPQRKERAEGHSEEGMDETAKGIMYGYEITMGYLLRDLGRSERAIAQFEKHKRGVAGLYDAAIIPFYQTLTHFALIEKKPPLKKRLSSLFVIGKGLLKFSYLAHCNPQNFRNKSLLLRAELAKMMGRKKAASKLYNRAIRESTERQFTLETALSCELAGRFFNEKCDWGTPKFYLKEAISLYEEWGAKKKSEELRGEFAALFSAESGGEEAASAKTMGTTLTETIKIGARDFDIESLQKSTETISSTIIIEELFIKLMDIVMEQAGADRGLLLTVRGDEELLIEAESSLKKEKTELLQGKMATGEELPLSLVQQSARYGEFIICDEAVEHARFKKDAYIIDKGIKSILCMPLMNKEKIVAILYLENSLVKKAFTEKRYGLLIFLSSQLAMSIDNARLYKQSSLLNEQLGELNIAYERFVPQDFLALLEKRSVVELLPGDQKEREMSALFMDIRSFTALSEAMTPQENFTFINEFIGYMEPVIRTNSGFIDKYIGDAIMALFPGNADDALTCAVEMVKALEKYNVLRRRRGDTPIAIGIGINSGKMILGTVGNEKRMDGTVISDAVNVASRVEHLTKEFETPILFTENSYRLLDKAKSYPIEEVGDTPIRGKKEPMKLYTIGLIKG